MTEAEWLAGDDPVTMLAFLRTGAASLAFGGARVLAEPSARKLRLFACAVVRRGWAELTDERSRQAVAGAECFADGEIDAAALGACRNRACDARDAARNESGRMWAARAHAVTTSSAGRAADDAAFWAGQAESREFIAPLVREIVGDPWHPATAGPPDAHVADQRVCEKCGTRFPRKPGPRCTACGSEYVRKWRVRDERPWAFGPQVQSLATAAYDERTPDGTLDPFRLMLTAEALEEAGCPTEVERKRPVKVWIRRTVTGWELATGEAPDGPAVFRSHGRRRAELHAERAFGVRSFRPSHGRRPRVRCADGEEAYSVPNPLLEHLRSPGPHVRGCWALDLVLGKE